MRRGGAEGADKGWMFPRLIMYTLARDFEHTGWIFGTEANNPGLYIGGNRGPCRMGMLAHRLK